MCPPLHATAHARIPAAPLPGSLKSSPLLDSWIGIDADGRGTVFTGKCELGQGIKTALRQVAAEQLGAAMEALSLVTSDTDRTANEGYTSGSQSMQDSGTAILHAAAQAREILAGLAAARLGLPAEQLKAEGGFLIAPDGRRVPFGELAADNVLHVEAQPAMTSKLRDPHQFKFMGQSLPRVDIPAKVTGLPAYVQDLRLENMVHARIVRPPSYGARLKDVDTAAVERMPGVRKVVRDGSFLAVLADREFRAVKAMEALAAAARWEERESMPDPSLLYAWMKEQPGKVITIKDDRENRAADKSLEAEYHRPFQMHASIGPSCAVAHYAGERLTVWSHAQGMFPLRDAIAELLKLPRQKVRCIHWEGSGCYGHN